MRTGPLHLRPLSGHYTLQQQNLRLVPHAFLSKHINAYPCTLLETLIHYNLNSQKFKFTTDARTNYTYLFSIALHVKQEDCIERSVGGLRLCKFW